ncbi:MAG: flagellar export protein FliJ, partial [Caulobacteraceae bacterium]
IGQIAAIAAEEAGARDALSQAFEELKKFEHVAEVARLAEAKELAKRETAAMDEMGLRKATGR